MIKVFKLITFMFAVFIIISCSNSDKNKKIEIKTPVTEIGKVPDDNFIINPFSFTISKKYDYNYSEIGPVLSMTESEIETKTDKEEFEYTKKIIFEGIEILVLTDDKTQDVCTYITVKSSNIKLSNGIAIGDSTEVLYNKIGKPSISDDKYVSYAPENEICWLRFEITQGKITEIVWMLSF